MSIHPSLSFFSSLLCQHPRMNRIHTQLTRTHWVWTVRSMCNQFPPLSLFPVLSSSSHTSPGITSVWLTLWLVKLGPLSDQPPPIYMLTHSPSHTPTHLVPVGPSTSRSTRPSSVVKQERHPSCLQTNRNVWLPILLMFSRWLWLL